MPKNNIEISSSTINILRVFATYLVFSCHAIIVSRDTFGLREDGINRLFGTPAWGGVWIFLVISGFLAAYGFESNKYNLSKRGILKYYKSRFAKVLLPTWIFISIIYIFLMDESHVSITTLVQWLTCTFNGKSTNLLGVGASWYVFVIMWLYFISPFVFKLFLKMRI